MDTIAHITLQTPRLHDRHLYASLQGYMISKLEIFSYELDPLRLKRSLPLVYVTLCSSHTVI